MQVANVNPPVTVTGRHLAITPAIKDYATKKIEGLRLDYPRIIEAHVVLEVDKYRQKAIINLVCCNHISIEAAHEDKDLYASIDEAISKVARQMRKYKTRLLRSHKPRRQNSLRFLEEQVFPAEIDSLLNQLNTEREELGSFHQSRKPAHHRVASTTNVSSLSQDGSRDGLKPVKTETRAIRPMFVDDAILQLELNQGEFFVFQNANTEQVNVLYRRKGGDFGLIQPELKT